MKPVSPVTTVKSAACPSGRWIDEGYMWLRAAANASPQPMKMVDCERRIRVWNQAAERVFGWTESEMVGQVAPLHTYVPDDYRQQWNAWFSHILSTGEPLDRQLSKRRCRDGSLTEVSITVGPLHNGEGETIGLLVAEADETERIRFLRIAAHELRNPMASVKGIVSLFRRRMESGRSTESITPLLEVVESEIDRLSKILNEILQGFGVAAGHLELRGAFVDLADVVRAAMRPFQTAPGVHRFVAEGASEAWVWGDARRLEDVLRNLLSNARKYSPEGGDVRVGVRVLSDTVEVTVQDQGMGIPEDELGRVFDPFYRSPTLTGRRDPGGLGLGLYLSADIVRGHRGRIWASNNPTGGAAIHVELPSAVEPTAP